MNRAVLTTSGIVLSAIIALTAGCAKKSENIDVKPLTGAEVSAESVWLRITGESPYTAYSFWPGHEGLQPGQAPHGPFHKVFVNHTLAAGLPAAEGLAPAGSIIVKENYSKAKEMTGITVMVKAAGYAPDENDWFWAKYSPAGEVQAAGQPGGCISCHAGMKQNDYVIIQPLME